MWSKRVGMLVTAFYLLAVSALPADAVTNPVGKISGSTVDTSWVVSLWTDTDEYGQPFEGDRIEFYCSGIAIGAQWVLTAAHCVKDLPGNIIVQHGADDLASDGLLLATDSAVYHQRYSSKSLQNDIGLIHTTAPMPGPFAKLSPSKDAPLVTSKKGMWLLGWGEDQNGDTGELGVTRQYDQTPNAKKYFKNFNPATMIAAGYYFKSERQWSGGCYGDSGGPLVTDQKPMTLVGIVSYGAESCTTKAPTVYTRVSYYLAWIKANKSVIEGKLGGGTAAGETSTPAVVAPVLTEVSEGLESAELTFVPSPSSTSHTVLCTGPDGRVESKAVQARGATWKTEMRLTGATYYNCGVRVEKGTSLLSNVMAVYSAKVYSSNDSVGDAPSSVDIQSLAVGFYEGGPVISLKGPGAATSFVVVGGYPGHDSFLATFDTLLNENKMEITTPAGQKYTAYCADMSVDYRGGSWYLKIPRNCYSFPSTLYVAVGAAGAAGTDQVAFRDTYGNDTLRAYP